jgi:hypothetical protein
MNNYDKENWIILYPIKNSNWDILWYIQYPCWNLLLPWDSLPNIPEPIWQCWNKIKELWEQCDMWPNWWLIETTSVTSTDWNSIIITKKYCTPSCSISITQEKKSLITWTPQPLNWLINAKILICKNVNNELKTPNPEYKPIIWQWLYCWDSAISPEIWEECEIWNWKS